MRRGHGSIKVPNVKLRPPKASGSGLATTRRGVAESTEYHQNDLQDGSMNVGNVGLDRRPYAGAHVCCTGIDDKVTVLQKAQELGAHPSNDLTDRITHLIADQPGSAKYKCALERKIPIMSAAWINEPYDTWLAGGTVSLQETIDKYRLPVFDGLRICISSMDDSSRRQDMVRQIHANGGTYAKEVDDRTSHLLICSEESADGEEVAQALKTNSQSRGRMLKGKRKAKEVHVPAVRIVWVEWLYDCLTFGGRWDEENYSIDQPRPTEKSFVAKNTAGPMPPPSFLSSFSSTPVMPLKRKASTALLRSISEDAKEEETFLARPSYKAAGSSVWADIQRSQKIKAEKEPEALQKPAKPIAGEESEMEDEEAMPAAAEIVRATKSKKPASFSSLTLPEDKHVSNLPEQKPPAKSILSRMNSARALSFTQTATTGSRSAAPAPFRGAIAPLGPSTSKEVSTTLDGKKPFTGLKFRAVGDANSLVLEEAITSYGGIIVKDAQIVDFIIIRLGRESAYLSMVAEEDILKCRTECWVEQCIFEERLLPADQHVTFRPLSVSLPIPDASALKIGFSGLEPSELVFAKRFARAIGAQVPEKFSKTSTSHLICPGRTGLKFEKALQWSIEVVDLDWLWNLAAPGKNGRDTQEQDREEVPHSPEVVPMGDITNSSSSQGSSLACIPGGPVSANVSFVEADASSKAVTKAPLVFGLPNFDPNIKHTSQTASSKSVSAQISALQTTPKEHGPLGNESETFPPAVSPAIMQPRSTTSSPVKARLDSLKRKSGVTIPSSETPSPLTVRKKPSTDVAKTLAVLLESHALEEGDAPQPPKKRMRPSSRAKKTTSGVPMSASASPASSGKTLSSRLLPAFAKDSGNNEEALASSGDMDESMRITYDDPAGREERNRLMSLVDSKNSTTGENGGSGKGGSGKGKGKGSSGTRRSTRVAGF